jgi:hypothetical protein
MKRFRLFLLLAVALTAAIATTPQASARLSCSDCINICLLRKCGFSEPPACVSANYAGCVASCKAQGSC